MARYVHWELCVKVDLDRLEKWYGGKPDGVFDTKGYKVSWDLNLRCDLVTEARRPDKLFISKQKEFR